MHRRHDLIKSMRAGHAEHAGMTLQYFPRPGSKTASHHHPAIFSQGLTNGIQGLFYRSINKPARVYDHQVGACKGRRGFIPLGPQPGKDGFRVHQRLGATETYKTDFSSVFRHNLPMQVKRGYILACSQQP